MEALGFNLPSLIAQLVNFTILLIFFRVFLYRPILRMLDERRRRIREGMEAAERMKEQEVQARQAVQQSMEEARREGQAFISQAQQIANRIQEESRQQAQREAEALLARARAEIQLERDNAITQVRREFADLAITAAERVIRQSLDRRAHQRLVAEVLAEAASASDDSQQSTRS